jgi:hypothetical protein
MQPSNDGHPYVEKIREETQAYVRKLIAENESLRVVVAELEAHNARLQRDLNTAQTEITLHQKQEQLLHERVTEIRGESEQYLAQFAQLEQHNANLANLYVASYQLHGTLDRQAVLGAVQEIVINLIGSEQFGIYERQSGGSDFQLIASVGMPDGVQLNTKAGSAAWVVEQGETYLGSGDDEGFDLVACVPLKLDGRVTGLIAIHRLLAHKSGLEPLDHELFDLLATHAATALYCTSLQQLAGTEGLLA